MDMIHFDLQLLQRLGLVPALLERARECAGDIDDNLDLLRVSAVHRETVLLHDGRGEAAARPRPRLVRELLAEESPLAVGDQAVRLTC